MCTPESIKIFCNQTLLPACWKKEASTGPIWCFNPALLRQSDRWLFAYRVVLGNQQRRIAACFLDENFEVFDGSQMPLSDAIQFREGHGYPERAITWFADPRLYEIGGRVYLYFNSGWHEPRNHQFLVELDRNLCSPLGPAKEIDLVTPHKALEKNWMFLADDLSELVYSPDPHLLARFVGEEDGRLLYTLPDENHISESSWFRHGHLRGGAPPVRLGAFYYSFCHFISTEAAEISYRASVYRFPAVAPYARVTEAPRILEFALPSGGERSLPKLNPAVGEVVYPCGAAWFEQAWHVSCGFNDEHCAILKFSGENIDATFNLVDAWSKPAPHCRGM
ncbi:MAG: hypothetical protein V4568_15695 [Pseudomonadota bacterium]